MTEWIHVRHPGTGGEGDIPADLLAHHKARGWEEYTPPTAEELDAKRPAKSAPVKDWQKFAVFAGMTKEQADAATKQELIDRLDPAPESGPTQEDQ